MTAAMRVPEFLSKGQAAMVRGDLTPLCLGTADGRGIADTLAVDLNNPTCRALVAQTSAFVSEVLNVSREDMRYVGGAIIPKYPGEPRRHWHVDWWNWDAEESRSELTPQVGMICYLDEAAWETGCLEVLRPEADLSHGPALWNTQAEATPDAAVRVPCVAGDAVLLDSRRLHAVSANTTDRVRVAVTLWFLVGWSRLSEVTQASSMPCANPQFAQFLGCLQPDYSGPLRPEAHSKIPPYVRESN